MGDTVQGPEARRDTIRDSSSDIAQMLSLTTELASILSDPRDKSVARDRMRRSSSQIEDLLGMHEGPGPGPWGRDSDQVLFDLVLGNRIRQSIMSGGEPGQAIQRRQASEFVEQNSPSRQLIEAFRQLIGAEGWGGSRDIPRYTPDRDFLRERQARTNEGVRNAVDDLPLIRRILAENPSDLRTLLRANALKRRGLTNRESTFEEADRLFETLGGGG